MPASRSPSRSPRRRPRRSASPPRKERDDRRDSDRDRDRHRNDHDRPRRVDAGFRWKDGRHADGERDRREARVRRERDERRFEQERPRRGIEQPERRRSRSPPRDKTEGRGAVEKPKKPMPPPSAPSGEPMIIVNVNDRLGTKAAIPCLASDPVGLFKAQVAARIGRQPHEILLKRQGERPFKDALTLEDYGVSNGVQLDLELDTGD
ncbi:MAG: hypothetical protein M1823_003139 [Watsoniomyces obsoletus]|nr:MAG: hypothetical protein M1823_003139 [Watsoniomyces obsoletus]